MPDLATELESALPGRVFRPGTSEYDEATSPDNSSFEQHPDLVVRPESAQDVATVVAHAGPAGVRVAVQATGHGAGEPIGSGVVLVDTSSLQSVAIDAQRKVARLGAGAQWAQVQQQAEQHGLLGLAGTSPTVGVAGYVVNGGVGWLARPHGLASAHLQAVEYVDGHGRIHRTDDADADPEAVWAFRGGAPVGLVTEVTVGLVAVYELWAGYLLWPAEHLSALAAAWIDQLAAAPSGLTSTLALLGLPPAGPFPEELLGSVVVHLSYASTDGEAGLAALRRAMTAVAEPVVDTTGRADAERLGGVHLDPPTAVPAIGTGAWLEPVDAGQVESIMRAAGIGEDGGLNMIEIRHVALAGDSSPEVDGALTRVPGAFLLHTVGAAPDADKRRALEPRLTAVNDAAAPVSTGLSPPGFVDGQPDAGTALPSETLERLRAVVRRHDPAGVFALQRTAVSGQR